MTLAVRILVLLLLLAALPAAAGAAPRPPRPDAGIGVLLVRPSLADRDGVPPTFVLYRAPGVGRIAEQSVASLPRIPLASSPAESYPLAVMAKRGAWYRVAYDDAGRDGWVEERRSWSFLSWEEFLKGRTVRLLPGLRKPHYALRSAPSPQAPQLRALTPETPLRIVEVQGDRARVLFDLTLIGWLQWRDEDGRLLIGLR
ncbi:hypothetical protein [Geobacter sp.]|uniref:hypothetical protein n=1 Tax=Geobacter sp. TaxID=46610 RepID=UPI002622ACEC|nr:hypothetical protein [Geobacter sp.]